jgi:hypothetical protein
VRAFYEVYAYPPDTKVDCDGYQAGLPMRFIERLSIRVRGR